jgi:hypothetical protein
MYSYRNAKTKNHNKSFTVNLKGRTAILNHIEELRNRRGAENERATAYC